MCGSCGQVTEAPGVPPLGLGYSCGYVTCSAFVFLGE
jgi:hypothetical protein